MSAAMIVDHAADAFFEGFAAEIDQQAERQVQQAQISQNLFAVQRQFPFYQKVGPKAFGQIDAIIADRNWRLSLNIEATAHELIEQDRLIDRFEQSRPQILMEVKSTIDGDACQFLDIQRRPFFAPSRLRAFA